MGGLAHRKPGKSQGESVLSPKGFFPGFPRMLCIRVSRFQRLGQKHKIIQLGRFSLAAAGSCLVSTSFSIRK
jgi:hypothetical protein